MVECEGPAELLARLNLAQRPVGDVVDAAMELVAATDDDHLQRAHEPPSG